MNIKSLARAAVLLTIPLTVSATLTAVALAQETTGSISGTVTDPSGAAIKGATITLTNTDRGHVERTISTDSHGFYTATSLPLGTYSVKIVDSGFKTELETTLVLHVNDALTVNRAMTPGSEGDTITVTADALAVNLEDAASSGLISGTQVRELVLNNRNYEQLVALMPGVSYGGASDQLYIGTSLPAGTAAVVSFSINGQRNSTNNWTIDGADNVDRGSNLTLLSYPSVDAISEFKVLRGTYSAAFGRSASSQVNVVTRSGTNRLHGTAYEFFRNDKLNANNYFNKLTATPTARPLLRYNNFGFAIGGPVYIPKVYNGKDKTFFFYSQEFRRVINYATVTSYVPTSAERLGDFSGAGSYSSTGAAGPVAVCTSASTTTGACLTYGTKITNISPTAQAYLKDIFAKVPLPNAAAGSSLDPHAYLYNQRSVFNDTQEFVRIDQSIGARMNIFYRYLHDSLPTVEGGGIFVGGGLPGVNISNTKAPGTTHLGHVTFTFSPTLLLDAGYAYSSGAILSDPAGLTSVANSPDIKPTVPFTNTLGNIPNLSFTSISTNITSAGSYRDYNHNHNVFGSLTKVLGNHTFIGGVSFDHYQKTENALGNGSPFPQGTFGFTTATPTAPQATAAGGAIPSTFDSVWANFLIGNANNGFTQGSSVLTPNLKTNQIEAYLQDNWKATHRLSLSLGVRYSYFPEPYDDNNILSNFDPSTYVAANAPTVDSSGFLCKTGVCANTQGLNSGLPNASADRLNGIILGTPGSFGHASRFGNKVGNSDTKDFAPRVGFAYDVYGDGKTSLRGGYGIAYDSSLFGIYEQNEFANPPFLNVPTYTTANFDNPAAGQPAVSLTVPNLVASPADYHTPYTQQYSLDLQQQITPTILLDIGYVGNHSTHLLGQIDINQLRPGAFAATGQFNAVIAGGGFGTSTAERPLNQIRPYRGYGAINAVETIFSSNYNGLQVQFEKRFSGKSFIVANYTFSRALTNNQSDRSTAPQNSYNIAGEYGRSALDRTNILTLDGVWELPWYREQKGLVGRLIGGWEISGIYAANSGLPLTVIMSGNLNLPDGSKAVDAAGLGIIGSSAASLRPNMVANPNYGYGQQLKTRTNWFNKLAFSAPTAASLMPGNEKRGVVNGPGYNRLDTGLFRNFRIVEGLTFQFRAEGFNVLNHTNWATVGTNATTASTFGQVIATRDPRILQIGGKLNF
jgi:hypothetical protein